jgi:hypothetical protein
LAGVAAVFLSEHWEDLCPSLSQAKQVGVNPPVLGLGVLDYERMYPPFCYW